MNNTLDVVEKIYNAFSSSVLGIDVSKKGALATLTEQNKQCIQKFAEPEPIISKLEQEISEYNSEYIPLLFIEKYCLSVLGHKIISLYPVNIGEAFVLSLLTLYRELPIAQLYFKLGASSLLGATIINSEKITDIEEVANFIITSLEDADMVIIDKDNVVILGSEFDVNEAFK